jgi:4-amino-4-deoxy-L-arabinose transferase-like glycosyltransferase
MVRHDYAAAMFALLAFLLYEIARVEKKGVLYVASGIAAGAGAMCHTISFDMLGAITLLIILSDGLRALPADGSISSRVAHSP